MVGSWGGLTTRLDRIARDLGPWTETLWSWSVELFTQTFSLWSAASLRSQMPEYSSPQIQRKLFWPRRKSVPSSIIPPCVLHRAV
jgi:hypothetical protein